jgi:hypothetical protein
MTELGDQQREKPPPPVLEYRTPRAAGPGKPQSQFGPIEAFLLQLPTLWCSIGLCWAARRLFDASPGMLLIILPSGLLLPVACFTALVSMFKYLPGRAPLPWFVIVNLLVNASAVLVAILTLLIYGFDWNPLGMSGSDLPIAAIAAAGGIVAWRLARQSSQPEAA